VEQKIQMWIYVAIPTWFLTKAPKTYDGEKCLFNKFCQEN
jgi:hypothetical protein